MPEELEELPLEEQYPGEDLVCEVCGFRAKTEFGLASHMRVHKPKTAKPGMKFVVTKGMPPDAGQLQRTTSTLLHDMREEYLIRRYQKLIEEMDKPKPEPQPLTQQSKFADAIAFIKLLKSEGEGMKLGDALAQIRTLREIEGELGGSEPESLSDSLIKEAVQAYLHKPQQTPAQVSSAAPVAQPVKSDMVSTEVVGLDVIAAELLSDEAKALITKTPESVAWNFGKKWLKMNRQEFGLLYKRLKGEKVVSK